MFTLKGEGGTQDSIQEDTRGGGTSMGVCTLMQFSQDKNLQSILNKWNCFWNIIHTNML